MKHFTTTFSLNASASASQIARLIRTAVVVATVSAMSVGAVSLSHAPAQTAATTLQSASHASHQVQAGNERWE